MSMMDNLKQNFPFLAGLQPAGKSSVDGLAAGGPLASGPGDTVAPGGLNQKPAVSGVVRVGKKPVAIAIGILCLGGGAMYVGLKEMGGGTAHTTHVAKVTPGKVPNVPDYRPPAKPKMPVSAVAGATSASSTPTVPAISGQPAHSGQPTRNAQPKNQRPSPQMKAAMAALSGDDLVGGSPADGGSQPNAGAQPGAPAQPLTVSQGLAPGTGKVPQNKSNAESGKGVYDQHLVRRPASPYELMEGSVIPATLNTAINSNLAGRITATVSRDVYDSESGAYLLIPAGSEIVGMYSSKVLPGQGRVAVAWQRIEFPNGAYINLGNMNGAGQSGKAGMGGEVDNHTWAIFKSALLMSLIETGVSLAQPGYGGSSGSMMTPMSPGQIAEQNMANTFGQAETQLMQREITIPPTIKIHIGAQLNVVVSKDLVFPGVYNPAPAALPASGGAYAPAAMINPYRP
jgi:type IV secretory pathway VirB10-like protein